MESSEEIQVEEEADSEDELMITGDGKDGYRSYLYRQMFSYLPMMAYHQALIQNSWDHMFWSFKE